MIVTDVRTARSQDEVPFGDYAECDAWLRKRFHLRGKTDHNINNGGEAFILENDSGIEVCQIIWLAKMDFCCDDYVALAHECLHVAVKILSHRGAECVNYDRSEPLNYLMDAIYGAFLKQLHREYKKTK